MLFSAVIIIIFLIWRAMLVYVAIVAIGLLPMEQVATARVSAFGLPYIQWVWGNFDGVNYVETARTGYHYPNYAYFPLYPLLISIGRKFRGRVSCHGQSRCRFLQRRYPDHLSGSEQMGTGLYLFKAFA